MNYQKLKIMLTRHEACKLKPYRCTKNKLTIGIGRNLEDNGISRDEAEYLLENDMKAVVQDLHNIFENFDLLSDDIQLVLADMRFQLGVGGFRKFKKTIAACKNRNWSEMARQMKDSAWYTQTPNRAKELIEIVKAQSNAK